MHSRCTGPIPPARTRQLSTNTKEMTHAHQHAEAADVIVQAGLFGEIVYGRPVSPDPRDSQPDNRKDSQQ